ncbi:MAG TPA: AI-2E family transporter, partial [Egibacteraceae bacterium]|nr:AI-2E family transporter [Egibacteraceae bacterium]
MDEHNGRRTVRWRADSGRDTDRAVRLAAWIWTAVGAVVLAGVLLYLVWKPLLVILAPVLFAGLIVYLLDPLVTRIADRGLPRWAATAAVYLLFLAVGAAVIVGTAPIVGQQGAALVEQAPDLRERGTELLNRAGASAGLDLHLGGDEDTGEIAEEVVRETEQAMADEASRRRMMAVLAGVTGVAAGAAKLLLLLALGPILAFYLLADLPRVKALAVRLAPPQRRTEVSDLTAALSSVVGGYA